MLEKFRVVVTSALALLSLTVAIGLVVADRRYRDAESRITRLEQHIRALERWQQEQLLPAGLPRLRRADG
jgi:hypothetical protein